jgi:hypothetical protein
MDNTNLVITNDLENHYANFIPTNTGVITVSTLLISGGNGGQIQFRDPWLVENNDQPNQFKIYNSPFSPGSGNYVNYDIFLNQVFYDQSCYSISVISPQVINIANRGDLTYYFCKWQGSSVRIENANEISTKVDFQLSNSQLSALLKGHGASNTATATGYNNGRRIVCKPSTPLVYHVVYSDYNCIWYTSTNNSGQTWSPELLISTDGTQNINPAIALSNGSGGSLYYLYIVWEQLYTISGTTKHRILMRKITVDGSSGLITLGNIQTISDNSLLDGIDESRPSIYVEPYYEFIWIAWKAKIDASTTKVFIKYYPGTDPWTPMQEISGVNGYPVIARSPNAGGKRTKIVWSDGVRIKYIAGDYSGGSWSWTPIKKLKDDSPAYNLTQPTFTIDNSNYGHLVYCGYYIYYVKYNLTNPADTAAQVGSTVALSTYDCSSPSISVDASGIPITVFFSKTGVIYRSKYQNGSWTSTNFADGKYPSLAEKCTTGATWTRYSSAPYVLRTDLGDGSLHKGVGAPEVECFIAKRFEYPVKDTAIPNTHFVFDLDDFSVNDNSYQFNDNLETDQITLSGSNKIMFRWQVQSMDLKYNLPLMRFYFKTKTGKYLLQTVNSTEILDRSAEPLQTIINSIDFSCKGSMTGKIVIEFIDNTPYNVSLLKEGEETGTLAKTIASNDISSIVPTEFSLKQNFPNPFNPVTQISYELPHACYVSLKIYNTNGQLVMDLVNGNKEAGRYQVVFDGTHLASGIYFYQLEAGTFSDVKRMVLIK